MFLQVLVEVCCPGIFPLCASFFSGASGFSDKPDVLVHRALTEVLARLPVEQVLRVVTGALARDVRAAHYVPPLHFFLWADLGEAALWWHMVVFACRSLRVGVFPYTK